MTFDTIFGEFNKGERQAENETLILITKQNLHLASSDEDQLYMRGRLQKGKTDNSIIRLNIIFVQNPPGYIINNYNILIFLRYNDVCNVQE